MKDKSTGVLSAISFNYIRSINLPVVLYFSLHSGLRNLSRSDGMISSYPEMD